MRLEVSGGPALSKAFLRVVSRRPANQVGTDSLDLTFSACWKGYQGRGERPYQFRGSTPLADLGTVKHGASTLLVPQPLR